MDRKPVTSSNIKAVGYDPASRMLQVEFTNGGVYDYHNVPPEEHQALVGASSIGRHFGEHIRGKYSHTKVAA